MAQQQSASPALSDFAVIVDPADNVAVVKTAVDAGLSLEAPGGRTVTLTGAVTPGHRFATRAIPEGTFVLQYGQPIGTSRGIAEGDPITLRNMSNEVPVVRDLPADLHIAPPDYFPASQVRDVAGLPPAGWPRRHAQLRADRADQHVREPRGAADCDDRRVHAVQPREVPQRRRRRRHPAQQGLRLLGRLEHRGDAAHAVELRRPSQRRRRDLHRAGVREDQPHGRREVPAEGARRARQARRPLRHPGGGRHAGGDRSRPEGSGGHAADRSTRRRAARRR